MNNQPLQHLAIIPDGNRRWAKQHAIAAMANIYETGFAKTTEIIEAAFEQHIPYLTIWASSYANLRERPAGMVNALEIMYEKKFRELATHPLIHRHHIRVEVIGEWRQLLKPETIKAAEVAIEVTAAYKERLLTVLVGYDGRRERGAAVLNMLADHVVQPADSIEAERLLRHYAWTGHLPDVDLIIRTGAWKDPHNSAGFLNFLNSESQLAFPQVLWPDFTADGLKKIVDEFTARERRMGK